MAVSYVERELKFDVAPDFELPDVSTLLPPNSRLETRVEEFSSAYFDTLDGALLQSRMTLRHRTGSADVGWQLKVPYESFREELRVEETEDGSVPDELLVLLSGIRLGQPLTQVAVLATRRQVVRLLDASGNLLAEIDDDTVHSSVTGATPAHSSWREVEIELGSAPIELLTTMAKQLRRAGARPASSASKLARVLAAPPDVKTTRGSKSPRAGDLVADYIAEQREMILAGDLALRRRDGSVVHKTRVATRRLRSTLRVFAPLFDAGRAAALDGELRWYAGLLGEIRDRQVLQARLDAMVDAIEEELLLGPVRARIDVELTRETNEHWEALLEQLAGTRYLALLGEMQAWVRTPPVTSAAGKPAKTLIVLVDRARRKVSKRLKHGNASGDLLVLHAARKAAKRARYGAEAAAPLIGKKAAAQLAQRYQALQDLLGEHQDSLVSATFLRRIGALAGTIDGESGFAFGLLYEREMGNARRTREQARRVAGKYA